MLLERIYEWAHFQPIKAAIVCDDVAINYASFSRAIDAARRFLEPHALPTEPNSDSLCQLPCGRLDSSSRPSFPGLNTIWIDSVEPIERAEQRARIYSFSKDTIANETAGLSNGTGTKSAPAVWHVGGCLVYDWRPDPFGRIFRHGVNSLDITHQRN